ncbi:MAG: F0F1 ATP synthase subunit delta [Lachnospiraceae bacterium]|jgi:F-type H+-transporting ATPase subunit delta|nr:F0F1 ATP synthase subunit delta [Lachnospiraceae bacterium]
MAKLISKTYGDALLELVAEQNNEDAMMEEVKALSEILNDNPDFMKLMCNPRVDMDNKLEVVQNVFGGRLSAELMGFLKIVVSKGRFPEIQSIFAYFMDETEKLKGIGKAYVTTPMELSADEKAKVEKRLLETTGYKSIKLNYAIDESLIGGMKIRIGDRVVDSSISTKIEKLKQSLMNTMLN